MKMKFTFLRYIIYAAIVYGLMEVMRLDALYDDDIVKIAESSYVEKLQNVLLGLMLIFLAFTKGFHGIRYLLLLIFGVFLIREQDAFLDSTIGEHSWKMISITYTILLSYFIYKHRKSILTELEKFISSASSGILFLGFTTLLIFSRMFGRKKFWIVVEGTENYTRDVKNAAEECTELFAYFILFIGVFEFFVFVQHMLKNKQEIKSIP